MIPTAVIIFAVLIWVALMGSVWVLVTVMPVLVRDQMASSARAADVVEGQATTNQLKGLGRK